MIEEPATVIGLQGDFALISTRRKSACGSCNASGGCGTSLIASLFPERSSQILVSNPVKAGMGDRVIVGLDESQLQKASLLLYAVPLLGLIAGAIAGQQGALWFGFSEMAELISILCGLSGLIAGLILVHRISMQGSGIHQNQARIIRIERVAIPLSQIDLPTSRPQGSKSME